MKKITFLLLFIASLTLFMQEAKAETPYTRLENILMKENSTIFITKSTVDQLQLSNTQLTISAVAVKYDSYYKVETGIQLDFIEQTFMKIFYIDYEEINSLISFFNFTAKFNNSDKPHNILTYHTKSGFQLNVDCSKNNCIYTLSDIKLNKILATLSCQEFQLLNEIIEKSTKTLRNIK